MKTTKEIIERAAQRSTGSPEGLYRRMLTRLLLSIELVMKEQGLTQSKLSDLIGMEQPQLSAILSGKNSPTLGTIARIAFALGDEQLVRFPHHERRMVELAKKKREALQHQHRFVDTSITHRAIFTSGETSTSVSQSSSTTRLSTSREQSVFM